MAQGKYLVFLAYPLLAFSTPWIPEEGAWKYSFEASSNFKPKTYVQEYDKYKQIERGIIALENSMHKINIKISLLKDNARNQENRNRLEFYRQHRKDDTSKLKAQLKKIEGYLYLDYKLGSFSNEIEYGYSENSSFGFASNLSRTKYSNSTRARIFGKYKLYEKKKKILSIKPHIDIEEGRAIPGIDVIWGGSKKTKKLDNFAYSSFGIMPGPIYSYETTMGSRFKDYIIILQAFGRLEKNPTKLYEHLLRKQYKIAKEFSPEFTISIGYFQDLSLSARRPLSNGFNIGIWGGI